MIRSCGGLAAAATHEWLERGRFARAQMQRLLTSSLLKAVREVLPEL